MKLNLIKKILNSSLSKPNLFKSKLEICDLLISTIALSSGFYIIYSNYEMKNK